MKQKKNMSKIVNGPTHFLRSGNMPWCGDCPERRYKRCRGASHLRNYEAAIKSKAITFFLNREKAPKGLDTALKQHRCGTIYKEDLIDYRN
jgi:hypothetical protein